MKPFLLVVCGQRGHGKTSFLKGYRQEAGGPEVPGLLDALDGMGRPVLLIDPIGSYAEWAEGIDTAGKFARLLLAINAGEVKYPSDVYRLTPKTDEAAEELFHVIRHSKLNCSVVVDEASMYAGNADLDAIARYNRNAELGGQSLVVVARRLKELPINVRSQADAVLTFRQTDPADLGELKKLGIDEVKAPTLAKGEALTAGAVESLPLPVQNVIEKWTAPAETS